VKSVVLININRQRASLILSNLFDENLDPKPLNNIPTPFEISKRERLFANNRILGHPNHTADIGVSSVSVFNLMRGTPSPLLLSLPSTNGPERYLITVGPASDRNAALERVFSGEDHILWLQRISKKHVHILISVSSNALKSHLKAWAHAYVLAELVSGTSLATGKTELQILEKEMGEVSDALKMVNAAFEQGSGIEAALVSKGWDVERSMICGHQEGKVMGGHGMGEEKMEVVEKRE
jgi:hypothetical protein